MSFFRIILYLIVCVLLCVIIKQFKPDFLPLAVICSVVSLTVLIADDLKKVISDLNALVVDNSFIDDGYTVILIKVLLISVLSKFSSDFCRDCGFGAIASAIEFIGKTVMISFTFPVINVIVELVQGLLV